MLFTVIQRLQTLKTLLRLIQKTFTENMAHCTEINFHFRLPTPQGSQYLLCIKVLKVLKLYYKTCFAGEDAHFKNIA